MTTLDQTLEQSITNAVAPPPQMNMMHMISWLTKAGLNLYPWWSPSRDMQLRGMWKQSDHLSGAMYTLCSKMTAIPVSVQPRDPNVKEHVRQAEDETFRLISGAEWAQGWPVFLNKFVEDLAGQDNGCFAEIIGAGSPDGPIIGSPITVRSLDSGLCQRTGDPIFPVIYHDNNGKMYKLHYTRVMWASQMPSSIADMLGVGFCAVSRTVNVAQNLIDILVYKQERLGSRPHRGVMVTKGGLDPEDVATAFSSIAHDMDSQALSRYSKIAVVGSSTLPEAGLEMIDMAGLPDNFDERTSVELGMATIALGFGMDARELFPSLSSGATRADALIQHLKQRGKGPGQIIQQIELLFNSKYLPPHLHLVFDYQDDEQDRQTAETKEIRARRWSTAKRDGALDDHAVRQQMVEVGDLTQGQFEELELTDGRLPDGTSVLALFYTEDKTLKPMLNLGQPVDPLDIDGSDSEAVIKAILEKKADAQKIIVNSKRPDERLIAKRAFAALDALDKLYRPPMPLAQLGEEQTPQEQGGINNADTQHDPRVRKVDLARPKIEPMDKDELEPDADDRKEAGVATSAPFDGADFSMIVKTIDSYRLNIRNAVRGYWSGQIDFLWFYEQMQSAITQGFRQAWIEGLALAGILPDEASDIERQLLLRETINERVYIDGFANFIESNSKANGGKLSTVYARAEFWVGGYTRVMNLTMVMASGDKKKKWTINASKESCPSCRKLNGQVRRSNFWASHGVYPKAWDKLVCRQNCRCTLEDTNEQCSRGRLPNLP